MKRQDPLQTNSVCPLRTSRHVRFLSCKPVSTVECAARSDRPSPNCGRFNVDHSTKYLPRFCSFFFFFCRLLHSHCIFFFPLFPSFIIPIFFFGILPVFLVFFSAASAISDCICTGTWRKTNKTNWQSRYEHDQSLDEAYAVDYLEGHPHARWHGLRRRQRCDGGLTNTSVIWIREMVDYSVE